MGVTEDLMRKVGDDTISAINRTVAISDRDESAMFITIAGGVAAIGMTAAALEIAASGEIHEDGPAPDSVMLAALVCAHTGNRSHDPIKQAYKDLETLKKAG